MNSINKKDNEKLILKTFFVFSLALWIILFQFGTFEKVNKDNTSNDVYNAEAYNPNDVYVGMVIDISESSCRKETFLDIMEQNKGKQKKLMVTNINGIEKVWWVSE